MAMGFRRAAEKDFEKVWDSLQPVVERAREYKASADKGESHADPAEAQLYIRWLETFGEEVKALETVHEASPQLHDDALRTAEGAANEVLRAITEAKGIVNAQAAAADAAAPAGA